MTRESSRLVRQAAWQVARLIMAHILYHLTIPPPAAPQLDAVVQDAEALRSHFGGELRYLNPKSRCPVPVPRALFGLGQLRALRLQEDGIGAHHIFNPDPFAFPLLRALRRPIIYSLTGGVGAKRPDISFFSRLAAVTVADEGSQARLRSWGLTNCVLVRPGIETLRFSVSPLALGSQVRVLVGSAPWSKTQFKRKGVEALLQAARQLPQLHLVFLWRGVLVDEMTRLVQRLGVTEQVTVMNTVVDVNHVLAGVHAAIALADDPAIIRPYPHSLMEALAAGKPVLVSRAIPMAAYVERTGCGVVIEQVAPDAIFRAIQTLVQGYHAYEDATRRVAPRDFDRAAMIASFQDVYESVLGATL